MVSLVDNTWELWETRLRQMGDNSENLNTLIRQDPFQKKLQPVHRAQTTEAGEAVEPTVGLPLPPGLPSRWVTLQEPGLAWTAGPSSATPARLWGRWFPSPTSSLLTPSPW